MKRTTTMKRTILTAFWATVGSATAVFAQDVQTTQNNGLDAMKAPPAEVRLIYPVEATDAARLEARREPREPVAEKDEYDVETPLGKRVKFCVCCAVKRRFWNDLANATSRRRSTERTRF